jgi:hypothetical protein
MDNFAHECMSALIGNQSHTSHRRRRPDGYLTIFYKYEPLTLFGRLIQQREGGGLYRRGLPNGSFSFKKNLCVCPNVPIPFQVMSHDSKCLCRITSAVSFSHRHTFISSSSSSSSSSIVDDYKWGESLISVGWDSRNICRPPM